MKTYVSLLYISGFLLEWEMFQTQVVDRNQIHILCSVTVFRKFYRLWDNVVKYARARPATNDNIIQRMRFACWITKATDTHSEYLIPLFHGNSWLRERGIVLCYSYLRAVL